MNFRDRVNELSLYIAAETTMTAVLAGHVGFGLVAITAGEIRTVVGTAILCRDPDPDPAHVLVCGKITHAQSAELRDHCRWVVKPARTT